MVKRRVYIRLAFLFTLLGAVFLQPISQVDIVSANWNGQGSNRGFFSPTLEVYNDYGTQVLPIDHAGQSMPEAYIKAGVDDADRATRLYNFIKDHYDASTDHEKTGAAYTARTMLGGTPGSSRTISAAEWTDLNARLQSRAATGNIDFDASIDNSASGYNNINTFYNTIDNDIAWYDSVHVRPGIEITNDDGTMAYALWYYCANPVGSFSGLPVALDFNLAPTISASPLIAEPGTAISLDSHVANSGSTSSSPANWSITASTNGGAASPVTGGSGTQQFPASSNTPVAVGLTQTIPDLAAGSTICYVLSVTPKADDDGSTATSAPACVTVSEIPKVQVLGGDLVVGRPTNYNTAPPPADVVTKSSFSNSTGRYFGSWSEYGMIPSGTVSGMASGAMYVGGLLPAPGVPNLCGLSVLTISNNTPTGCQSAQIGNYSYGTPVPNVASRFLPVTSSISGASVDTNSLISGQVYSIDGTDLALSSTVPIAGGGPSTTGKWVIINDPEATVVIKTNINYSNSLLRQIDDIPQVVIIAKNIIIDQAVTNVDAWLIAVGSGDDGYINTCGSTTPATISTANAGLCRAKLTVNGPILANKLYMYRTTTAGTSSNPSTPAEVFNLRADSYIWASAYSPGIGRVPTVSTKELPPRF